MAKRRKPRVQVCARKLAAKCALCPETREQALQTHRVVPGSKYRLGRGVLVLCASCHSLVTAEVIKILGIRECSWHPAGIVHWLDAEGQEHFTEVPVRGWQCEG